MKYKVWHRALAALTAGVLCCTMLPSSAFADESASTAKSSATAESAQATAEESVRQARLSMTVMDSGFKDSNERIDHTLFDIGDSETEMPYGSAVPLYLQVDCLPSGSSVSVSLNGDAVFTDGRGESDTGSEGTRVFDGEECAAWVLYVRADSDFTATATYSDSTATITKSAAIKMVDVPMLLSEGETQYHITDVSKVSGEWLITFEGEGESYCMDEGLNGKPTSSVYWSYYGTTDLLDKAAAAGCSSKVDVQRYVWAHRGEASDNGSAYVYAASEGGWQNVITRYPPDEYPPDIPDVPTEYTADWSANVEVSASANFSVRMTTGVDKFANITHEKLSDAEITITPTPNGGGLDGGSWSVDPASQIIKTENGDGSVSWTYAGSVSKSASRSDSGSCTADSQEGADEAAASAKREAENRLRADAQDDAQSQANAAANAAAALAREFLFSETGVPHGFDATAGSNQTLPCAPNSSITASIANQPWQASVKWEKLDSITGGRLTEDTEFILYEWSKTANAYQVSPNYRVVRLADGTYTVRVTNTAYTDWKEGLVYYTQQNLGKFKITEVAPAYGYTQKTDSGDSPWSVEFEITQQNQVVEYLGENADRNQPWGNKVIINKTDSETGKQITGDAVFSLYEWNQARSLYKISTNYAIIRAGDGTYTAQRLHTDWTQAQFGSLYFEDTLCDLREDTWNSDENTSAHSKIYTDYDMANYPNSRAYTNDGQFLIVEHTAPADYYGDWTDPASPGAAGGDAGKRAYYLRLTGDGSTVTLGNADYNADILSENKGGTLLETASGTVTVEVSATTKPADRTYTTDPTGLAANEDSYTVSAAPDTFKNTRALGYIELSKVDLDAMKTLAPGSNGETTLEGAVYDLYAAESIQHPDGKSGIVDYSKIVDANGSPLWHTTVLTNGGWKADYLPILQKDRLVASAAIQDGKLAFANLYLGKYYLVERATGLVLMLDDAGKYCITGSYPLLNGKLQVTGKTAKLAVNGNGEYTDYVYKNQYSAVAESRALNGRKTYDGYYLSYATGYLCDEINHYQTLLYGGESQYITRTEQQSEDEVLKSGFELTKLVSSTGSSTGIKLEGAGFTVYTVAKLTKAGEFAKNADGSYQLQSVLDAYRADNYDQDNPKYNFTAEEQAVATMYEGNTATVEAYNATLTADGDYANGSGRGWVPTDKANQYRLAEIFSNEEGKIRVEGLTYGQYLVVETTIPKDVFQAYPFLVRVDSKAPQSKFSIPTGSVTVPSNSYMTYNILDEELEGYLQLEKTDAETGKTVKIVNTAFSIYYIVDGKEEIVSMNDPASGNATQKTTVFYTDSDGQLKTPEKLPLGKYRIVEIEGPEEFFNDKQFSVEFELTSERVWEVIGNSADSMDDYIIRETYSNHETLGQLTIRKIGNVLTGLENGQFTYEQDNFAGAVYEIHAHGDIATKDRQGTLWYADGDLVATVTTGAEGQVDNVAFAPTRTPATYDFLHVTHNGEKGEVTITLPLGSYDIKEVKAPYGFILTDQTYTVTFGWDNQNNDLVLAKTIVNHTQNGDETYNYGIANVKDATDEEIGEQTLVFENARVVPVPETPEDLVDKIGVGIYKTDRETKELLPGAVFELYTVDAIHDANGKQLAAAGDKLAVSAPTDASGFVWFPVDVPMRGENYANGITVPKNGKWDARYNSGNYRIVEITAPDGYLLDSTPLNVAFTYPGQNVAWQVVAATQTNKPLDRLYIRKTDVGGQDLPGATLTLKMLDGTVMDTWLTDGTAHKIPVTTEDVALPGGIILSDETTEHIYMLNETAAPAGYAVAADIQFKVMRAADEHLTVYYRGIGASIWSFVDGNTLTMLDAALPQPTPIPTPTPVPPQDDTLQATPPPSPVRTPSFPQTGDPLDLILISVVAVGAIIGAGVVFYLHKRKHSDDAAGKE